MLLETCKFNSKFPLLQVIYRWWHISPRNMGKNEKPGEMKSSYEEFLNNDKTQHEIWRVFGEKTLEHVKGICNGHLNYLQYLPKSLLIRILTFLSLEDVARFGSTCRQFRELSTSNDLWELLYMQHAGGRKVSSTHKADLQTLASELGWKKLYFTNRIQLQLLLSRQREKKAVSFTQRSEEKAAVVAEQVSAKEAVRHAESDDEPQPDLEVDKQQQNAKRHSITSVSRLPNVKSLSANAGVRRDNLKKSRSALELPPDRPEAVLDNLPPEVRYLESLGPAVVRPAPRIRPDVLEADNEPERPQIDERAKQERVKAWLREVQRSESPHTSRKQK